MVEHKNDSNKLDDTTVRVLLGIVMFFAGLIGLVVVVGLLQGKLDPTGTATLLGGIVTGIVAGLTLRKRGDGNG